MKRYHLILSESEIQFLKQLLNADGVNVAVKHAATAGALYAVVHNAKPVEPAADAPAS